MVEIADLELEAKGLLKDFFRTLSPKERSSLKQGGPLNLDDASQQALDNYKGVKAEIQKFKDLRSEWSGMQDAEVAQAKDQLSELGTGAQARLDPYTEAAKIQAEIDKSRNFDQLVAETGMDILDTPMRLAALGPSLFNRLQNAGSGEEFAKEVPFIEDLKNVLTGERYGADVWKQADEMDPTAESGAGEGLLRDLLLSGGLVGAPKLAGKVLTGLPGGQGGYAKIPEGWSILKGGKPGSPGRSEADLKVLVDGINSKPNYGKIADEISEVLKDDLASELVEGKAKGFGSPNIADELESLLKDDLAREQLKKKPTGEEGFIDIAGLGKVSMKGLEDLGKALTGKGAASKVTDKIGRGLHAVGLGNIDESKALWAASPKGSKKHYFDILKEDPKKRSILPGNITKQIVAKEGKINKAVIDTIEKTPKEQLDMGYAVDQTIKELMDESYKVPYNSPQGEAIRETMKALRKTADEKKWDKLPVQQSALVRKSLNKQNLQGRADAGDVIAKTIINTPLSNAYIMKFAKNLKLKEDKIYKNVADALTPEASDNLIKGINKAMRDSVKDTQFGNDAVIKKISKLTPKQEQLIRTGKFDEFVADYKKEWATYNRIIKNATKDSGGKVTEGIQNTLFGLAGTQGHFIALIRWINYILSTGFRTAGKGLSTISKTPGIKEGIDVAPYVGVKGLVKKRKERLENEDR